MKKLVVLAFLTLFAIFLHSHYKKDFDFSRRLSARRFQYGFDNSILSIKYLNGEEKTKSDRIRNNFKNPSSFYIADIALSFKNDCAFQEPDEKNHSYWFPECSQKNRNKKAVSIKTGEIVTVRGSVFCPRFTRLESEWQCAKN
jgi:hypothetical protein